MPLDSQLGFAKESAYGTETTPNRFVEYTKEGIAAEVQRVSGKGLRAGRLVDRADRFVPAVTGYAGSIEFPVLSTGFAFLLEHMLGAVATSSNGDAYDHVGTIASLCGKGLTVQVNRPLGACGDTDQAHTFSGGKIAKWTLSCEPGEDGALKFEADLLFDDGTTGTALASASYGAGAELLAWPSASVSIDGTDTPVTKWSVECDNKLKDDRLQLRNSAARREPVADDVREIKWTISRENDALNTALVAAAAADTILDDLVLTVRGAVEVSAGVLPGVVIELPAARVDEGTHNVEGPGVMEADWSGMALAPASGEPITITVTSTEATP